MDHFHYRNGELHCENVRLAELAERAGTPLYVYSKATLLEHFERFRQAFADLHPLICFSLKSCENIHIARTLIEQGAGIDVVSGGEIHRARLAGAPGDRIVFAGVGKSDEEIALALGRGADDSQTPAKPVRLLNIESESEFHAAVRLASRIGVRADAALRVNPDVDPNTHRYTTTGKKENKFGVNIEQALDFFDCHGGDEHVRLTGLHAHIGSPIAEVEPYVESTRRLCELMDSLRSRGRRIDSLDLGGGFAADYETRRSPTATQYAEALVPLLRPRVERDGLRIILEPGRSIAANAGALLTRVRRIKDSPHKKFVICDAGMHTLIRPALYEAFHFIWPVSVNPSHMPPNRSRDLSLPGLERCDVVGPLCESGDFLGLDRDLPPVREGDTLAVFAAGAYGSVQASRYNAQPLPAEALIDGDDATLIRRAETLDTALAFERKPSAIPF